MHLLKALPKLGMWLPAQSLIWVKQVTISYFGKVFRKPWQVKMKLTTIYILQMMKF